MSDTRYMLDASALLALIFGENGATAVDRILPQALISAVNLCEVVAKLQDRGVPDAAIEAGLAQLNLAVQPFDREQAGRAGLLRAATKGSGLSLGDRACLAAADMIGAVAITTDRAWRDLHIGIQIEMAR